MRLAMAVDGALFSLSQQRLELGEGLLDGIEVGREGRQEHQAGAGRSDRMANADAIVRAEIIETDDIAWLQYRNQLFVDLSLEQRAVERPVDQVRRDHGDVTQGRQKRQRLPLAMWCEVLQPLAAAGPSVRTRHIDLDPGLVDEEHPADFSKPLKSPP